MNPYNALVAEFTTIRQHRSTLKHIVRNNLLTRYSEAFLGTLWTVISPLFLMFSIWLVFSQVTVIRAERFPLFLLCTILPWMFFASSLSEAAHSMYSVRDLLSQFNVSPSFYVYSLVISNFISYVISLLVVLPFFIYFLSASTAVAKGSLLMLLLLLFFVFVSGACVLTACLSVYLKDIAIFLQTGLTLLFWLTPIFYSPDVLPRGFKSLLMFNPLVPYMVLFRSLLYQQTEYGIAFYWIYATAAAVVTFIVGIWLFKRHSSQFIKHL